MDRTNPVDYFRRGISLLELLTVLAITGLLLSSAIPVFQHQMQGSRVRTQANTIITDLNLARSAAIRRNGTVLLCESRDHHSCTGDSNWSEGWIVFADANRNNQRDLEEPLIRIHMGVSPGIHVTFNGAGRKGDRWLQYRPTGSAKNGTFTVCDRSGSVRPLAVIVYRTGRPRVSSQGSSGKQLECPT